MKLVKGQYGRVATVYQGTGGTIVRFAGRARMVDWKLSDVERQAREASDPDVRAEWAQLAADARAMLADSAHWPYRGQRGPKDMGARFEIAEG